MIMRYSSVINIGRYYHFPNTRHSRLKNTFEIFALSDLSISTLKVEHFVHNIGGQPCERETNIRRTKNN